MGQDRPAYYPCIGYCMIDTRGYCVACGRPPSLGLPEVCKTSPKDDAQKQGGFPPSPDTLPPGKNA